MVFVLKTLGLPREAMFYERFADELDGVVPKCRYARGDMSTGRKFVVMEDLQGYVPMGIFFGKGNPNNWSVEDFDELVKAYEDVTVESLVHSAFSLFMRLHAKFWCDRKLLQNQWLRGAKWMMGQERKSWQSAIDLAVSAWGNHKEEGHVPHHRNSFGRNIRI